MIGVQKILGICCPPAVGWLKSAPLLLHRTAHPQVGCWASYKASQLTTGLLQEVSSFRSLLLMA